MYVEEVSSDVLQKRQNRKDMGEDRMAFLAGQKDAVHNLINLVWTTPASLLVAITAECTARNTTPELFAFARG